MALDPLTAGLEAGQTVVGFLSTVIDKIWPDPAKADAAKLELLKLEQAGELQQMVTQAGLVQGQLDINKAEAASPHWFVAAGRPAIIWVGAVALALMFWPYAIAATVLWAWASYKAGAIAPKPDLGVTDLLALLAPMLGISGLRSFDKVYGTATGALSGGPFVKAAGK